MEGNKVGLSKEGWSSPGKQLCYCHDSALQCMALEVTHVLPRCGSLGSARSPMPPLQPAHVTDGERVGLPVLARLMPAGSWAGSKNMFTWLGRLHKHPHKAIDRRGKEGDVPDLDLLTIHD